MFNFWQTWCAPVGSGFGGIVSDWPWTVVNEIWGSWSATAVMVAVWGLFERTASLCVFWREWRRSRIPGKGFVWSVPWMSW